MSTRTESGHSVEFDPFSDVFFDDPYETYARLRDEAPVYFNERYGFYALSRHVDVVAAHQDTQRFSSSYGVTVDMLLQKRQVDMNMMIIMDKPGHTQLRRLVNQAFSRRTIEGLEPLVIDTVRSFVEQLDGRHEFDIVADFAALFPVEVISAMLGVPVPDRQQIRLPVGDHAVSLQCGMRLHLRDIMAFDNHLSVTHALLNVCDLTD